jgi:hypothetical protein
MRRSRHHLLRPDRQRCVPAGQRDLDARHLLPFFRSAVTGAQFTAVPSALRASWMMRGEIEGRRQTRTRT